MRHKIADVVIDYGRLGRWPRWAQRGFWVAYLAWNDYHGRMSLRTAWEVALVLTEAPQRA